ALKQLYESAHVLVIQAERQQLGVIERRFDPVIAVAMAVPASGAQMSVLLSQLSKGGLFAVTFHRVGQIACVHGLELGARCQNELCELAMALLSSGIPRW